MCLTLAPVLMGVPWAVASAQIYLVSPPLQEADERNPSPQPGPHRSWLPLDELDLDPLAGPLAGPLDGVGTLEKSRGGLGPRTWAGLTRVQAGELIEALPVGVPSPAMNDLARRVLLSSAPPPVAKKGEKPGTFLTLRVRKAFQMGFQDDVIDLFQRVRPADRTDGMIRYGFMALALDGNGAEACRLPQPANEKGDQPLRIMAYCRVELQKRLMTPLELAEMAAVLPKDDALVAVLERRAYLTSAPLPRGLHFDPLSAALLRDSTCGFPDDVLETARPWLIRAVARTSNPANEALQRAAHRKAADLGLVSEPGTISAASPGSPLEALAQRRLRATDVGVEAFRYPLDSKAALPPHLSNLVEHLQKASNAAHPGETALLALCILGSTGGPKTTPGDLFFSVLTALEQAGMEEDARKLAIEALDKGVP